MWVCQSKGLEHKVVLFIPFKPYKKDTCQRALLAFNRSRDCYFGRAHSLQQGSACRSQADLCSVGPRASLAPPLSPYVQSTQCAGSIHCTTLNSKRPVWRITSRRARSPPCYSDLPPTPASCSRPICVAAKTAQKRPWQRGTGVPLQYCRVD